MFVFDGALVTKARHIPLRRDGCRLTSLFRRWRRVSSTAVGGRMRSLTAFGMSGSAILQLGADLATGMRGAVDVPEIVQRLGGAALKKIVVVKDRIVNLVTG